MTSDSTDGEHCLSTSHIELYSKINTEGTQTEQTHIITSTRCILCTLSSRMVRTSLHISYKDKTK